MSSCDDYLYVGCAIIKIVKLKTRIVKQVKLGRRRRNTAEEDEAKKKVEEAQKQNTFSTRSDEKNSRRVRGER